ARTPRQRREPCPRGVARGEAASAGVPSAPGRPGGGARAQRAAPSADNAAGRDAVARTPRQRREPCPSVQRVAPPRSTDDRPVVVAALRTPIGTAGGALADVSAADLAAPVLRALADAV